MSNRRGKVSVIIPVHNRHELFNRCLASVINQKWDRFTYEIIVIDDGSSPAISQHQIPKSASSNIRIIRNSRALGPSVTRNIGLKAAGGEYIAFLDSDDTWHPDFISATVTGLDSARPEIITTLGKPNFLPGINFPKRILFLLLSLVRICSLWLFWVFNGSRLPVQLLYLLRISSSVFTRKAVSGVYFSQKYRAAEDWKYFWDCISNNSASVRIIPQLLAVYTYEPRSETLRRRHYWGDYYKLLEEFPQELRRTPGMRVFRKYTDISVAMNKSYPYLNYYPKD